MLLLFFLRDWVEIVEGILRSFRMREVREDDVYARLGWLLVVGTVPAGILGLLLQESLRKLFASPSVAAAFLIVNGVVLLVFERLRERPPGRRSKAVRTRGSRSSAGARRSRSGPPRPLRSSRGSHVLGSRWAAA